MIDHTDSSARAAGNSSGLHPFFLFAAVGAVAVMVVWLLGYTKREPLLTYYGSSGWHAHEMLFGYMAALLAGLLLVMLRTVPERPVVRPVPLVLLMALWLAGRALPMMNDVPPWLVATVDLAFLPLLAMTLAPPLLKARRYRDLASLVAPLWVMSLANLLVHSEWLGWAMDSARLGVVLAIYMLVLLMGVVAGRVIPQCLERELPARPATETAAAVTVLILAGADLFAPTVRAVVICALLAAAVHAWRWIGWLSARPRRDPLAWALLAGYAWLIAGLVLIALSYGGYLPHMLAFHALMVGGFGGLSLAIMAQLARRQRQGGAPALGVLIFVILNLAALLRVAGPLLSARFSQAPIIASGALWVIGFSLFLLLYGPLLMPARLQRGMD